MNPLRVLTTRTLAAAAVALLLVTGSAGAAAAATVDPSPAAPVAAASEDGATASTPPSAPVEDAPDPGVSAPEAPEPATPEGEVAQVAPAADAPAADGAPGATSQAAEPAAHRAAGPQARAAASSSTLAPGTYTVTANPYVAGADAPIGVDVFLADGGFPPITPQRQNARLVVAPDGTMEVSVDLRQEIFTLQRLEDGADVRVVELQRGGQLNWMGPAPADAPYTDRITRITAALGHADGEYTFGAAVEYPTLLQTEKTWTIHLRVDLAHAVRDVEGDVAQTYTDGATGVAVTVSAPHGSPTAAVLPSALLAVSREAAGPAHDAARATVARGFVTEPDFVLWPIALTVDSVPLELAGGARAAVTLPTASANPLVYLLADGALEALPVTSSAAGTVTVSTGRLGGLVVVDGDAATPWSHTKAFTGTSGTSMTYRTTGMMEVAALGMDFDTLEAIGLYSSYLGEVTAPSSLAGVAQAVRGDFTDPDVRVFTFGLDMSFENIPGATTALHRSFLLPLGNGMNALAGSVPVPTSSARVYLVSGTAGTGFTTATPLETRTDGRTASFDLVGKDEATLATGAMPQLALWNAATGKDGDIDTPQSATTPIAAIAVVREAPTAIPKPVAASGLVYDATTRAAVPEGPGYTLGVTPTAVRAGQYVATATLRDGYVWDDGTTDAVVLPWSIAPATLTARYVGESIVAGSAPGLRVDVTGFVGGEDPATARGYTAPTATPPAVTRAGESYELTPAGGAASDYAFAFVSGTLRILDPGPATLLPGTYRVTANLYVPAEQNDILGVTAYLTNPKNPLVPEGDPDHGVPTTPVAANATLVVDRDGRRTVVVDLPNPAFTLVDFGAGRGGSVQAVSRAGGSGRITSTAIALDEGVWSAVFAQSHVYAAPVRLDKTWDVHLAVDPRGAVLLSTGTETVLPGDGAVEPAGPGAVSPAAVATAAATSAGRLRPGTYTVSANIWLSREVTGLPLDPHLTSGAFPPMDPVTDNATLVVAADGRAEVTVPVLIQSRIMTVRGIVGDGVRTSGSGSVSTVTIDLGVLTTGDAVVTRPLQASVTIGDLAMSIGGAIFGGTREHTWPATFALTLSGVPRSGGGAVPAEFAAALAAADAADADAAAAALDAARRANEDSREASRTTESVADTGLAPVAPILIAAAALAVLIAAAATIILVQRARRVGLPGPEQETR